jgi:hypothetical protein
VTGEPKHRHVPRWILWVIEQVPYLYLTRFPLLLGVILLAYGPFAQFLLPTLFQGTLVLDAAAVRHVALVAGLAAFAVLLTRRIILLHGPERFGTSTIDFPVKLTVRQTLLHGGLAVPLLGFVAYNSRDEASLFAIALSSVAGLGFAVLLLVLTTSIEWTCLIPSAVRNRAARVSAWFSPWLGRGYLAPDGSLLPSHRMALSLLIAYVVWYSAYYWLGHPGTELGASIPTIGYLLVLATMWTWILAALAFYLDRHRVPTLVLVVIWSAAVSSVSRSDHYFLHHPAPLSSMAPTPEQIALAGGDFPLVVVAADGGGIQASAWNATVLSGLQRAWPEFGRSLRLVSSVSGGSVGAMYFVNAMKPGRSLENRELDDVVAFAMRDSLNEVGWGLTYPDFWRTLLPIPPDLRFIKDRAWAMETAWARGWSGAGQRLSDWARQAGEGWRPAVAFNTTIAENGRRFLITTFAVPEDWHVGSFADTYSDRDLDVVTAARLSATFPYVTPASRAWPDEPGRSAQHFADAGYFDNSGILTALQWLGHVLGNDPVRYRDRPVVLVRIASAPDYEGGTIKDRSSWYQLIAPLVAVIAVRQAAQLDRMKSEVDRFRAYWCTQGVDVVPFTFQFRQERPPMSWRLTSRQRGAIGEEWGSAANKTALRNLLITTSHEYVDICPSPPQH